MQVLAKMEKTKKENPKGKEEVPELDEEEKSLYGIIWGRDWDEDYPKEPLK